jgi:hypothetical protein
VREYIERKTPEEYCLLAVRRKFEYERVHLPVSRRTAGVFERAL